MSRNQNIVVKTSRACSFLLRHQPQAAGLTLDPQGWIAVDELLAGLARINRRADRALLERVVAENDKQRFEFSPDGGRIRARQGHSVSVDLGLDPQVPPDALWHGTVARFLPKIHKDGLQPQGRHHVHLSADRATATAVGNRRGSAVLLRVDAAAMDRAGHRFYCTANGVWLADGVPPGFLDTV